MNSVGTAARKSSELLPSADQVNNTVSAPLVLDVKRYFKNPCGKPGHLPDNKLKSCSYCLRRTAQIFLRAKPTRAFMNNQERDLNPTPGETDSAKTIESVQREGSELPVDQQSSYLRSRQIALKKFSPQAQGGDPS
jgi:hypothetical protein